MSQKHLVVLPSSYSRIFFIPLFPVTMTCLNRSFHRLIQNSIGPQYSLVLQRRYIVDDGNLKYLNDEPKELLPEEKILDNF